MFTKLIDALKATRRTIVFTEGPDARILEAADRLIKDDLMNVILIGNVDDMVIAEQNWQPMIDTILENRTVEDYETTSSTVKTDFMRKWHHNRSGKPISLDEMMESEDGDIFDVADPRGEFENSVISEMQIASFSESTITEKDREIRFVS